MRNPAKSGQYHRRNHLSKLRLQFLQGCFGVFDGVVKERSPDYGGIGNIRLVGKNVRKRKRVIDVRRCIRVFAMLISMLEHGEVCGLDNQTRVG